TQPELSPLSLHDALPILAAQLNRLLGTDAVVVSLSDAGLILVPAEGAAVHVPAYPVKLRDTSGAGDTVVAALAVLLATKAGYERSEEHTSELQSRGHLVC